jgi:hypothetical protein
MATLRVSATIGQEKNEMTVATNATHAGDMSIVITDTNFRDTHQVNVMVDRLAQRLREELLSGSLVP